MTTSQHERITVYLDEILTFQSNPLLWPLGLVLWLLCSPLLIVITFGFLFVLVSERATYIGAFLVSPVIAALSCVAFPFVAGRIFYIRWYRSALHRTRGELAFDALDEEPETTCTLCERSCRSMLKENTAFCFDGGRADCPFTSTGNSSGTLTVLQGPYPEGTVFYIRNAMTTFGRMAECDVPLLEGSVSRRHAAIKRHDDGQHELRDFDSASGTYVNGEKMGRCFLESEDVIRIGDGVEFRFEHGPQ